MNIKRDSFELTGEYLKLLFAEVRLREQGADATVAEINRANEIRMEINMASETLRRHVKLLLTPRKRNQETDMDYRPEDPDYDNY
jgi:hypothetical protein